MPTGIHPTTAAGLVRDLDLDGTTSGEDGAQLHGARPSRHRRAWRLGPRQLVAGGALCAAGVVVKRAVTPCPTDVVSKSGLVSLAEVQTKEIGQLLGNTHDRDLVRQWLEASTDAATAAANGQGDSHDVLADAQQAVKEAMAAGDGEANRQLMQRVIKKSMSKWHGKREELRRFVRDGKRSLRFKAPRTRQEKAITAECVFNVEQAVTQLAALGASIADSAKTCVAGVSFTNMQGKVCILNLAGIMFAVSTIAGSLSMAATNCASTIMPNVDALCAGALSGLGAEVSQLAGMATLTNIACDPTSLGQIPPGALPQNLGQPVGGAAAAAAGAAAAGAIAGGAAGGAAPAALAGGVGSAVTPGLASSRRLDEAAEQMNVTAADARQLLYGGGMGATATQCYVDVTSVMWWLAQAGLAINGAANKNAGASCPSKPMDVKHGGKALKYAQALCTVDVAGAIYAFGTAVQFLLLSLTHCPDVLNLKAMCGAGIDGMIASLAGLASSGSAAWITCFSYQEHGRKAALKLATLASKLTAGRSMGSGVGALQLQGNFGRRLADTDDDLEKLKAEFDTPEAAWKSIGYDLEDPDAEFRGAEMPVPPSDSLVSLAESVAGGPEHGEIEVQAQSKDGLGFCAK